jgi:putative transposase
MRKSRFSDEQMVAILREADRTSVAEAAKKNKVSEQTIYIWRKHFAGLTPADVKRLKALELENAKLKRLLAERDLEVDLMREVNRKNGEPTGSSRTDPLPRQSRPVATTCLWAARRTSLDNGLPLAPTGEGRAGVGCDAPPVVAVSAVWLSPHPHLPAP